MRFLLNVFCSAGFVLLSLCVVAQDVPVEGTHDAIVVGAGVSGLTAGFYLRDYDVLILEREDHTGGSAMSASYEGVSCPIGDTRTLFNDIFIETLSEFDNDMLFIPPHEFSFFHNGKIYYGMEGFSVAAIEESGFEELGRFYGEAQNAYIKSYYLEKETYEYDRMTAKEWFDNQAFAPLFYQVYGTKARQMFGAGLDEISAQSLLFFLFQNTELLPFGVDPEDIENKPESDREVGVYVTFPGGMKEYADGLAGLLEGKIQLNSNVESITQDGEWMTVTYSGTDGNLHALQSRAVVLAVPGYIVKYLAPDILSEEQLSLLEQIPYSSLCYVSLFGHEPLFGHAYDLQFPDDMFITDLIDHTWAQRKQGMIPEDSNAYIHSVIIAPPNSQDQSFKELTDEEIIEKVYADLETFDPDVRSKVLETRVDWFSNGVPVMDTGAFERLDRLHEITNGPLALCGSYAIRPDIVSTLLSGQKAAEQAIRAIEGDSAVECFEIYE